MDDLIKTISVTDLLDESDDDEVELKPIDISELIGELDDGE